ncbi:MAG TPA: hypothetical protein VE954_17990 [Oligoflexus sp.]|uniref:hypothetical protein n=1 Tax=Oligoflexus sp. TaxID=1971216 RepID=UPI002D29B4B6|nr:hypothetical protein [Oligoflexus sp.]HYX34991.1 hypothetical protein [Oligoflexus sp.]
MKHIVVKMSFAFMGTLLGPGAAEAKLLRYDFTKNNCTDISGILVGCKSVPREDFKLTRAIPTFSSTEGVRESLVRQARVQMFYKAFCESSSPMDFAFRMTYGSQKREQKLVVSDQLEELALTDVGNQSLSVEFLYKPSSFNYVQPGCFVELTSAVRYLPGPILEDHTRNLNAVYDSYHIIADMLKNSEAKSLDLTNFKDYLSRQQLKLIDECLAAAGVTGTLGDEKDLCLNSSASSGAIRRLKSEITAIDELQAELNQDSGETPYKAALEGLDSFIKKIDQEYISLAAFLEREAQALAGRPEMDSIARDYRDVLENISLR